MVPAGHIKDWVCANLFDTVPVCICVIDRSYRIVVANELFSRTYGSWENRYCYAVYKGRTERCVQCGALMTFADGKIRTREEEGQTHDGRHMHYLVHLVPIADEDGEIRHVIEMSTDISGLKQLEKEKTEAERLAAVGETVAGIAHGIKNVLMGLEGGMYVFNTGLEKGDEVRMSKGWTMLEGNITRISRFVREFLDFARGRQPAVTTVDPNEPARKVVELFREKASMEGVTLVDKLDDSMDDAFLDEEAIHTCLANLVSNAIHACTISDSDGKHRVTLSSREKNGSILYEVTDDGCGMDYEISRKIFSSFFSTKSSEAGTGLGLLTTKKIAHQHGGKVSFDTEEGVGSVFRIELPRRNLPVPEAPETEDGNEKGAVMVKAEDKTILVVDDEPDVRNYLSMILEDAGFNVVTANDGVEALEIIHERKPDFISLDLVMPRKSGQKLLYELRKDKELSRIPVLIVTAHAKTELGKQDLDEIMVDRLISGPGVYLEKPVKPQDYVRCVQRALGVEETGATDEKIGVKEELEQELRGASTDAMRRALDALKKKKSSGA